MFNDFARPNIAQLKGHSVVIWIPGLTHCDTVRAPPEIKFSDLCAEALFVLLLKSGAVLSIIYGFLMAVSCWRHMNNILQCIVIVRPFLRMLKLRKLAVWKLDLLRGVSLSVTVR